MGQSCSSLKVCAHLEVVGQCGGADRLTLCLPRSRGKGGRRLLGAFSFPSGVDGAGHHRSARRTLVAVGKVAKKDGATPVRVDFLAGSSLVARREIPLADLLAGLRTNTIGRRSALFFSLKAGQAEDAVSVFYSGRLLDEPGTTKEDQQEPAKTEQHASLPPQAGQAKLILPPCAVYTNASNTVATEVTYCVLTAKVTVMDLLHGRSWVPPQAQPRQAGETLDSLTSEVIHRDLGDGQRWVAPQAHPRQERGHTRQAGETPGVVHRDLGDGERWAAPQAQLRHRRGEPHGRSSVEGREGVVLQPSVPSPRDGRGLVNSLLQCAQAMALTVVLYHVSLEWF